MNKVAERLVNNINDLLDSDYKVSNLFNTEPEILRIYIEMYDISRVDISKCISVMSRETIEYLKDILDWKYISHYEYLSVDFISNFGDYLDWSRICKYQHISLDLLEKVIDKVQWVALFSSRRFDNDFLIKYFDLYWGSDPNIEYALMTSQKLSSEFIESHWEKLNKKLLCKTQDLSFEFINNHISELPKKIVVKYQRNLSKDIINKYFNTSSYLKLLINNRFLDKSTKGFIKHLM